AARLGARIVCLPETAIPAWNPSLPGEHRHANHLFGLYPGTLITQDDDTLMDAAKVSLINRGFEATGWSKAWKLNMWARTGDAENSYKLLQSMNAGHFAGMLENLLDSHPPFQIDGNYGYTAGMQEMLMQSQNGYLEFLPTLPEAWATGNVEGFVARGNFTVDMNWSAGTANTFKVVSNLGNPFTGRYPGIANATVTEMRPDGSNARSVTPTATGADQISFPTTQNKVYVISFNKANGKLLSAITAAQSVVGTMSDSWLNAPKALLASAISAAQSAAGTSGTDFTTAINTLNKAVNTANGAIALSVAAREAQAFQEDLAVGDLPWQYGEAEKASYNEDVQSAVGVLLWATGSTKVDEYLAAQLALKTRTDEVRARTDALAVSFSWAANNVTMSVPYPEAEVRYTLDGSEPGRYSNIYLAPVAFNNATTIRAALFHDGERISPVAEYLYRNTPDNAFRTATVTSSAAGGIVASGTNGQPARAYDGNTGTSLNGDSGSGKNTIDFNLSLTVAFAEPVTASSTRVLRSTAATANYWINKFRLEYSNDGGTTWETAYTYNGPDTTPTDFYATFPEFTASMVRLHVLEGWAARIVEWELYDVTAPLVTDKAALTQVRATYQAAVDAGIYPEPAQLTASLSEREARFIDTLGYADAVLANLYADQATVDHATSLATTLVPELGLEPKHDEAALISAITAAEALKADDYDSDDKVADFAAALAGARAARDDDDALQARVDQALARLLDAQAAMEATAKNWSYLNGIVTAAQGVEQDITDGKYLQVNVPAFLDALDAAVVLQSRPKSRQYEINAAAAALLVSLGKLVTQDKADLLATVEEATGLYEKGLAVVLTPDELAGFNAAYEAATAVLYNPNAGKAQADEALSTLKHEVDAAKAALAAAEEAAKKPEATVLPSIGGVPAVGSTLKATSGSWSVSGLTFAYQWLRNGAAIAGATKASYKVVSADAGKDLSVRVTASVAGRADGTATSAAVRAGKALTKTPTPTISGTAKVGKTLTAKAGSWAPSKVTLKYQWLRDGAPIAKATKSTYKLAKADAGRKVSVRVTGSKSGYASVARTSKVKAIAKVKATLKLSVPSSVARGRQATVKVSVSAAVGNPTGSVRVTVGGKSVTASLAAAGRGQVSLALPALTKKGSYKVKATFTPSGATATSTAKSSPASKTLKVS
ncbi:MAG: glycoside hydrolase family 95-like protein, partial [Propionicimonas sp.]